MPLALGALVTLTHRLTVVQHGFFALAWAHRFRLFKPPFVGRILCSSSRNPIVGRCRKNLPLPAPNMSEFLLWPADFDDPNPVTDFDAELATYFDAIIASGGVVRAIRSWTSFTIARDSRMVDFTCRGRLRRGAPRCWEIRPIDDSNCYRLGTLFGIRDHACIVIAGIDDLRSITNRWLTGLPLEALLDGVTYWDKTDTTKPLEPTA